MKENRYRLSNIKLALDESSNSIPEKITKMYRDRGMMVTDVDIVKASIDARRKGSIKQVFTVDFSTNRILDLPAPPEGSYREPDSGTEVLRERPVIVGFGPCGMFAALMLAKRGYKPIVLERGYDIDKRIKVVNEFWQRGKLDGECNVQFGEGGAGTFSDGKLTTGIKDERKKIVLREFVGAGANEDILYNSKPHIGTDVLRYMVRNIRHRVEKLGGEVRFDARVNRIIVEEGRIRGVVIQQGYQLKQIHTDTVVLAIGHSSRDTLESLVGSGVEMEQKPFSIGVRIEHPQEVVDRAQYGDDAGDPNLPHAVYNLAHHCKDGRGVYTFCMCPGGEVVVASSEADMVVTNGMSYRNRASGTANSGLLVDVRTEDFRSSHVLAGVEFQRKYEKKAFQEGGSSYRAPSTTWGEFKNGSEAAKPVTASLPSFAVKAIKEAVPEMGKKLKGFDADSAVLTAVETRSSSPVRILRDENMESNIKGLFPSGEGAGYAGGIMSSAVDGIKTAEEIIKRYAPFT